jgi:dihydropteroate synthase
VSFWFQKKYDKLQRRIFPQFKVKELAAFPIRPIRFSDPGQKSRHEKIVAKVDMMLAAKKQLAKAGAEKDRRYYETKCAGLDHEIDRLVYDLYGLTEEEIKLVEEAAAARVQR